jgi:hypothetical protein
MRHTIRSALAAVALTVAAFGSAATAVAAPSGPCEDVPFVGVCEQLPGSTQSPSQQSMGEVILPNVGNNIQSVG